MLIISTDIMFSDFPHKRATTQSYSQSTLLVEDLMMATWLPKSIVCLVVYELALNELIDIFAKKSEHKVDAQEKKRLRYVCSHLKDVHVT